MAALTCVKPEAIGLSTLWYLPVLHSKLFNRRQLVSAACANASLLALGSGVALAQGVRPARARIPITKTGQDAIGRTRGRLQFAYDDLGLRFGAPIYLRVIKDQKRLEIWVQGRDGEYVRLRGYRICGTSAQAGPRRGSAVPWQPEGFYALGPGSLRPSGVAYLGIDIGWPNALDRAQGWVSGTSLLQAGCASQPHFGLTDQDLEEVYTLVHGALSGGQTSVPLHIFPFAMGALAMMTRGNGPNTSFWRSLAPAWRQFESTKKPPQVRVSGRRYVVVGR
jgi:murein L,D-transpeptidase YafK